MDYKKWFCSDREWETYLANLYYRVIDKKALSDSSVVVEFAPGFRNKCAIALSMCNYCGTYILIDSNECVVENAIEIYKKELPNAKVLGICCNFDEIKNKIATKIDLFLSNHCFDDMIIYEYLNSTNKSLAFNNNLESKEIIFDSWKKLSKDKIKLNIIMEKIYNDWKELFSNIRFKQIIIAQYKSQYHIPIGNMSDIIAIDLMKAIKKMVMTNDLENKEVLSQLYSDLNSKNDFYKGILYRDPELTDNIQDINNWIIGTNNYKYYKIPQILNYNSSSNYISQVVIEQKENELLYFCNNLSNKFKFLDESILAHNMSISLGKDNINQVLGLGFVDKQFDPLNIALNGNLGSGRAFFVGSNFNIKGVKTELATSAIPWYSDGLLALPNAIKEAIISNVISIDFKIPSYKTLALFDSNQIEYFNHYEDNYPCSKILRYYSDKELYRFSNAFIDNKKFTKKELLDIVDKIAELESDKFIHRFLHGAWSAGNLSINCNIIDFDSSVFVKGRHPQFSYTSRYKTNFFGYEIFGQLKIIKSIIDFNYLKNKVDYKTLEKRSITKYNKMIKLKMTELIGLDIDKHYLKYKREINELGELFITLSRKAIPNYGELLATNSNNDGNHLFDFAKFFKYALDSKYSNLSDYICLIFNKTNDVLIENKIIKKDCDEWFKNDFVTTNDKEIMSQILTFIKLFIRLKSKLIYDVTIDFEAIKYKAFTINTDRDFLLGSNPYYIIIADLYKKNIINKSKLNLIMNLITNSSIRNFNYIKENGFINNIEVYSSYIIFMKYYSNRTLINIILFNKDTQNVQLFINNSEIIVCKKDIINNYLLLEYELDILYNNATLNNINLKIDGIFIKEDKII